MDNQNSTPVENLVLPATILIRLTNYILDRIFMTVPSVGIAVISFFLDKKLHFILSILGVVWFFAYFIFFESIWQKTPAKWITKTKVVDMNGNKPSFLRILGRSLTRFIPFEPLSFLFSKYPIGWHDSFSKTYVVSDSLTPEDVKRIDKEKISKAYPANTVGIIVAVIFVVLFALFIIGVLSSVVLASLSTARNRANDAAIRSVITYLIPQSAVYNDKNNSYTGFCSDPNVISMLKVSEKYQKPSDESITKPIMCNDSQDKWVVSTALRDGSYLCVDNAHTSPIVIKDGIRESQLSCMVSNSQ